jgi:hypothetical protein
MDEIVSRDKATGVEWIEKKLVLRPISNIKIHQKNFKKMGKDRRKFCIQLKAKSNNSFFESMAKDCFQDCFICNNDNIKNPLQYKRLYFNCLS